MSLQFTVETMDHTLSTFLEGTHIEAEGKMMMKELVCGLGIEFLISSLKAVQVNYREQVVAKTTGTTLPQGARKDNIQRNILKIC